VITEADTCRKYVLPKLYKAGWDDDQISEQKYFTDGRIVPLRKGHLRKEGKRADYLLRYRPDFALAVVEAKAAYKKPGAGMQQAMDYAQILDLRFAYATNGHGIEEYDFTTGRQTSLDSFPSPEELWRRLRLYEGTLDDNDTEQLLFPFNRELRNPDGSVKRPRYYQEIAINRAVKAVIDGRKRILLTMATGTGKTFVAMQIGWKLWKTRRMRKILYLADRNILVDQAKDREFSPFGDAVHKIHVGAPVLCDQTTTGGMTHDGIIVRARALASPGTDAVATALQWSERQGRPPRHLLIYDEVPARRCTARDPSWRVRPSSHNRRLCQMAYTVPSEFKDSGVHLSCLLSWNGSIPKGRHRSTSNGFSSIGLFRVAVKRRFDAIIAH